jgi:hypothetical protein
MFYVQEEPNQADLKFTCTTHCFLFMHISCRNFIESMLNYQFNGTPSTCACRDAGNRLLYHELEFNPATSSALGLLGDFNVSEKFSEQPSVAITSEASGTETATIWRVPAANTGIPL